MRTSSAVMVVWVATMVGVSGGVLLADRGAWLFLMNNLASQLAVVRGYLFAPPHDASAKPEPANVIPTGFSSIVAIQYSSKPDSTHMEFDLQATDLVRSGKLRNPDRIYFDLQSRKHEQGAVKDLNKQKTVSIPGNLLTGVRISQRKQGAMRIVLDLKCSCDFTYQTSSGSPARLLVEVRPHPTDASAYSSQRNDS